MKIENIKNIREYIQTSGADTVNAALKNLRAVRPGYRRYIRDAVSSGFLDDQIILAARDAVTRQRTTADGNKLSSAAGAYFLNEDVIGGSQSRDTLTYTNNRDADWMPGKLKLGPGISLIEPPAFYSDLMQLGAANNDLAINYDAPFGSAATRRGIKQIMDAKIDPEADIFPTTGVYLTQGATEGIDLFMEMLSSREPASRVVFLGLSYYTGPYSAVQKGLNIDRIIAPDLEISRTTKFFPTAEQIAATLPPDTSALVLTMPNNPNGETYSDDELQKILQLAKDKKLLILFDCIFEDLYFNDSKNNKSRLMQIANDIGALDNIVIVDSLSKTQNLPGARIGFLATANNAISESLEDIVISRRCNPQLTMEPVIQFEGVARKVKALEAESPTSDPSIVARKILAQDTYPFDEITFMKMYNEWDDWNTNVKEYYRANLDIVAALLEKTKIITAGSPDEAAFNTFAKLSGVPDGTNSNDFLAKLMFTLATYTQSGACFGLSQDTWDNYLGMWVRISYASSRSELIEGVLRLIIFTQEYADMDMGNSSKYLTTDINYNKQI